MMNYVFVTGRFLLRAYPNNPSGFDRLQTPMAASACIDDTLRCIVCFGLLALGVFARSRADDGLLG